MDSTENEKPNIKIDKTLDKFSSINLFEKLFSESKSYIVDLPIIKTNLQKRVDELNKGQKSRMFHPYTCGGNRTDEKHLDGEGILVATEEGWMCPYCDYRQSYRGEIS